MTRVYTDYMLPFQERWRAVEKWFATYADYEEFRYLFPELDPRDYLWEAGKFLASYLGGRYWYLPRERALSIAAIMMMEAVGWVPEGFFRRELLLEIEAAEELDEEPENGAFRLIYSSDDDADEEE
jgi:hypothetical protein